MLSKSYQFITERRAIKIDTAPFTQAQPIWAQILTGKDWFENGCTGYVFPSQSLSKPEVFTESKLLSPVTLFGDDSQSVSINMPLLLPRQRLWVGDGSLPIAKSLSPSIVENYFTARHKPRAYQNLAMAFADPYASAKMLLDLERDRLASSIELLKGESWRNAIIRISAFDQLQHLFGVNCFDDTQLKIHSEIVDFMRSFDKFLDAISQLAEISCISAYSHSACRSRFNVNALLRKSNFLVCSDTNAGLTNRLAAAASVSGPTLTRASMQSVSATLNPQATQAASPTSGCIYINEKAAFTDGCIADSEQANKVEQELRDLLTNKLQYYFGDRATIYAAPPSANAAQRSTALPRVILFVPEVEFFDNSETILDTQAKPIACHRAEGFILVDSNTADSTAAALIPCHAHQLLRKQGFGEE